MVDFKIPKLSVEKPLEKWGISHHYGGKNRTEGETVGQLWWHVSDLSRHRAGGLFVCVDKGGWRDYSQCDD